MATYPRRARRAHSPRSSRKCTPVTRDHYKSRPEFRVIHGLKSATYGFTLVGDQFDLMDMDAPETLPAGSHESFRPMPDAYPEWWAIQQTTARRGGSHLF